VRSVILDFLLSRFGSSFWEEGRQETISPFADAATHFPEVSQDAEMSEGLDPRLGVQIDTVEKRTIDVEKYCLDHGRDSLFEEVRDAVSSIDHRSCERTELVVCDNADHGKSDDGPRRARR
jgi:hypothetical protein